MKKILAAVTVIAVLSIAGSAMAYGGRHHGNHGGRYDRAPNCPHGYDWHHCGGRRMAQDSGRGMGGGPNAARPAQPGQPCWGGNMDIPQNIKDKMVEADKLRIDLRAEMSNLQVDKAKAMEIWKKHRALRNEIAEWFFARRLEQTPVPQIQPTLPTLPTLPAQPGQQANP